MDKILARVGVNPIRRLLQTIHAINDESDDMEEEPRPRKQRSSNIDRSRAEVKVDLRSCAMRIFGKGVLRQTAYDSDMTC